MRGMILLLAALAVAAVLAVAAPMPSVSAAEGPEPSARGKPVRVAPAVRKPATPARVRIASGVGVPQGVRPHSLIGVGFGF